MFHKYFIISIKYLLNLKIFLQIQLVKKRNATNQQNLNVVASKISYNQSSLNASSVNSSNQTSESNTRGENPLDSGNSCPKGDFWGFFKKKVAANQNKRTSHSVEETKNQLNSELNAYLNVALLETSDDPF